MSRDAPAPAPTVSVVIVNWNTRDLLEQTLRSLHDATSGVDFETIVVDNGSTDGSADLVRDDWPGVRLVGLPENRGFTGGNNRGIAIARGRYVLLLNSDTIVLDSTLPGLVKVMERERDVGCAGARHLNPDGSLQPSMDHFPSLGHDLLSYSELYRVEAFRRILSRRSPWFGPHDRERDVGWVNGACIMVRREAIDQVGTLDEGYFIYGEELDWCFRMKEAGWRVVFTPDAEVIHLGGQAMNNAADRRVVLKYAGQLRFYRKHYPAWRYAALRVLVIVVALARLSSLVALALARRLGMRPAGGAWQLLTQEPVVTDTRTMIGAWWRILRMR